VAGPDKTIQELYTFTIKNIKGVLPVFSSEEEYKKFYEVLTTARKPADNIPPPVSFEMPGAAAFTQIDTASEQTNLTRVVFNMTVPPSFSVMKPKLVLWRQWAEIIQMERFYDKLRQVVGSGKSTNTHQEAAILATMRFPHFLGVTINETNELLSYTIDKSKSGWDVPRGNYISLFTALDRMGPYLDRSKFTVAPVNMAKIYERCLDNENPTRETGIVVNCADPEKDQPAAVFILSKPIQAVEQLRLQQSQAKGNPKAERRRQELRDRGAFATAEQRKQQLGELYDDTKIQQVARSDKVSTD